MRHGSKVWISMLGVAGLAAGSLASAQAGRQPGLWEVTTSMTWQHSPFPAGMQMPPQAAAAFGGAPHTSEVCLTQEMIDRYGAPMPQSHGECQVTNISKTIDGMTADMVCSGHVTGKGTIESHWSMGGTATGKVHFTGTMQMGPNATPIEWTAESSSVFKGSDCGSVKPLPMPREQ